MSAAPDNPVSPFARLLERWIDLAVLSLIAAVIAMAVAGLKLSNAVRPRRGLETNRGSDA